MMARYGDPVITWWNAAFEDMVTNGDYTTLCEQAQKEHGTVHFECSIALNFFNAVLNVKLLLLEETTWFSL